MAVIELAATPMSELRDDDPLEWMDSGACRELDPDLFFPSRGEDTSQAKAVCASCPVQPACLDYGMTQRHGIWGGLSERERRRLRRARRVL